MYKSVFPRSRIRFIATQGKSEGEEEGPRPTYVDALDGVPLALYKYFPPFEPDRVLLFYHEAGVYQCSHYHEMALELSQKYHMGVYLAELRGHGFSGGKIDLLGSAEILLDDIQQLIRWSCCRHMHAKLYLGAHSQSCSLITYYAVRRQCAPLSALVLISPYFGPFSISALTVPRSSKIKSPLSHTKWMAWFSHYLSGGSWSCHRPIWQFDPSPLVGVRDTKRVSAYKSEMARFMNIISPRDQLSLLEIPFLALLPSRDDRLDLARLLREMEQAREKVEHSQVQQARDADFITSLQLAPAFISKQTTLQKAIG